MTDAEIIEAVMAAGDLQESKTWDGNMLATETFSSASVGKSVTYTLAPNGGFCCFEIADV